MPHVPAAFQEDGINTSLSSYELKGGKLADIENNVLKLQASTPASIECFTI
jgi:hypothetical protein